MAAGTLYVVATPMGNAADLTERARDILKQVDRVFCADTRVTAKLLASLDVTAPLEPFHDMNGARAHGRALEFLEAGEKLALVTDGGTPGVADAGHQLVAAVRAQFGSAATIVPVPGVSPVTAILSVSGFQADRFVFLGYPPAVKARSTFFRDLAAEPRTVVLYEISVRLDETLSDLDRVAPERPIVLGRELTTLFEDVVAGEAATLRQWLKSGPNRTQGVFALAIGPQ
jgi:16S rRNA (cytidine1402-2'-O)-methyltransferase